MGDRADVALVRKQMMEEPFLRDGLTSEIALIDNFLQSQDPALGLRQLREWLGTQLGSLPHDRLTPLGVDWVQHNRRTLLSMRVRWNFDEVLPL